VEGNLARWKETWCAGSTAPLTTSLKQALHEYGFATPAEQARAGAARVVSGGPREPGPAVTAAVDRADAEAGELIHEGQEPTPVLRGAVERPYVEAASIILNGQRVPHPITHLGQQRMGAVGGMFEVNPELAAGGVPDRDRWASEPPQVQFGPYEQYGPGPNDPGTISE
jgi:hypothetical protein